MNYYRSKVTGKIITEKALRNLYDIYGQAEGNIVDHYILKEVIEKIDPPTLEDCIRHGNDGVAIIRFREMNEEASFADAKNAVQDLRRELKIPYSDKAKGKKYQKKGKEHSNAR